MTDGLAPKMQKWRRRSSGIVQIKLIYVLESIQPEWNDDLVTRF
jgi:hypothetical protein